MNYFDFQESARRYHLGRPYYQEITIQHIQDFLLIKKKLGRVLDTGSGTGLSSKALLKLSDEVYSSDISPWMQSYAPEKKKIHYSINPAESQPYPDGYFDLITVGSAVHWFNIDAFLQEAHRLLKKDGFLILYENNFPGEMETNEDFHTWYQESYLKQYPPPPRNKDYPWNTENLKNKGFHWKGQEEFPNTISFSLEQLVLYLTTHSNIINLVENQLKDYESIEWELNQSIQPYFLDPQNSEAFIFRNKIRYIQKI